MPTFQNPVAKVTTAAPTTLLGSFERSGFIGAATIPVKRRPHARPKDPADDEFEHEAEWTAGEILAGNHAAPRLRTGQPVVQRQEAPEKPREQPSKFPVEDPIKTGTEKEDAEKEALVKAGLKAAGELAKRLFDAFSSSAEGQRILSANERDWKPVITFFEDFSKTVMGKLILGAAAGGAAAGMAAGAWGGRDDASPDPDVSPSTGGPVRRSPKDEKFFTLELNWDFVSPPSGVTLRTPWLDAPKIGKSSISSATPAPLGPPPAMLTSTPLIPRICTPADPRGDRGEADERSAFIYGWLKYRAELEQKQARELLQKYGAGAKAVGPPKNAPSVLTPMFDRKDANRLGYDADAVEAGLKSSSRRLDAATRHAMQAAFGHDFGNVRIHTDQEAAKANEALNAHAYTMGRDVVFGAGKYAPFTSAGRQLLAHELAHVVQQHSGSGATSSSVAESTREAENEAVAAGGRVKDGQPVRIRTRVTGTQCAPASDTGLRTQFVDPGTLTRDKIIAGLWRMAHLFETATSTSLELTDIEQKALPRYVEAFVRLSRHDKLAPTLPGLDPRKAGHQKVLRLLSAGSAGQINFLEPPKPVTPVTGPEPKAESALEKFVRAHEREISQLPRWNHNFAEGLKATRLPGAMGASWEKLKSTFTSVETAAEFYFGFTTGVPVGAVKDVYDQFKDIIELLLKSYLLNQKAKSDPSGALREVRQFAEALGNKVVSLFDPYELGVAVGWQLAKRIDVGFVTQDAKGQGRFIGEQVGKVLMEVALLFIGVEEVSAAAKALRGSKVGTKMAESLATASKELKSIMEVRGALKSEGRLALTGGKEAKGADRNQGVGGGRSETAIGDAGAK